MLNKIVHAAGLCRLFCFPEPVIFLKRSPFGGLFSGGEKVFLSCKEEKDR